MTKKKIKQEQVSKRYVTNTAINLGLEMVAKDEKEAKAILNTYINALNAACKGLFKVLYEPIIMERTNEEKNVALVKDKAN